MNEIIYSLERCSSGVPDACRDCAYDKWPARVCVQHLTKDALELLRAQETKQIIGLKDENNCHEICINCGFIHDFIGSHTGQYLYCPQCGKRMKWE